jgi:hypothetical protein
MAASRIEQAAKSAVKANGKVFMGTFLVGSWFDNRLGSDKLWQKAEHRQ